MTNSATNQLEPRGIASRKGNAATPRSGKAGQPQSRRCQPPSNVEAKLTAHPNVSLRL